MIRLLLFLLLILPLSAVAQETTPADEEKKETEHHKVLRPDDHAPIGVMGDHRHQSGEWMVSYRYMRMKMAGSLNGSSSISDRQILRAFRVTPTRMTMDMHMLGFMTAPNDTVTVAVMLPFVNKDMDHVARNGRTFSTQSSGLGDIRATALIGLVDEENHKLHFNAGVGLPTGSITARDTTPMGPDQLLPYPMQLGSGTLDLIPGMTYTGKSEDWSWGAQVQGVIRTGKNKRGYTLGNEGELSVWGARRWNDTVSTSLRLKGTTWGDISGSDPALNPRLVPTADPTLRAGSRLDVLGGVNLVTSNGHRLLLEGGVPLAQSLDGPQLRTDYTFTAGWQYSF